MRRISPDGPVYQAGTLSGNPLAMAAGLATLESLRESGVYDQLEVLSDMLATGLRDAARAESVAVTVQRVGSMLSVFFTDGPDEPVVDYAGATACRTDRFAAFFGVMLDEGVMLAPSAFETWFVSTAHEESCITRTLAAARKGFAAAAAV